MEINNPAARLLKILEAGKEKPNTQNCRHVWAELLGVDVSHTAILVGRIGKVIGLSVDIVECLNRMEGVRVDRFLAWSTSLDRAFSQCNLNGKWNEFIAQIDGHTINYLTMTSELLSTRMPEPTLSEEKLDKILRDARGLMDEIRGSELPDDVKKYMLQQLYRICLAVDEYQITGAEVVSNVVFSAFGHAVTNRDIVEASARDSAGTKFWGFMHKTALVVAIVGGSLQISSEVRKLLPDSEFPTNDSEVVIVKNASRDSVVS